MTAITLGPGQPEGATVDKATARLPAETIVFFILGHEIHVSLAYHEGILHEIVFLYTGGNLKWGDWLTRLFHELGIYLSRAIQGLDPATGKKAGA